MGKGEMRSHLSSGIWGAVFGTPVSAPNAISPGQNPTPPGIWGQIPPASRLGHNRSPGLSINILMLVRQMTGHV